MGDNNTVEFCEIGLWVFGHRARRFDGTGPKGIHLETSPYLGPFSSLLVTLSVLTREMRIINEATLLCM
jgi:hypothetical protein